MGRSPGNSKEQASPRGRQLARHGEAPNVSPSPPDGGEGRGEEARSVCVWLARQQLDAPPHEPDNGLERTASSPRPSPPEEEREKTTLCRLWGTKRARSESSLRGFLAGLAILGLCWGFPLWGQVVSREYQLKAVFLYRFTQFTEWPEAASPTADTPIVIGVLGKDPFGKYLDLAIRNERVHNRRLTIQRYQRSEEAKNCDLVFISTSEEGRLEKCLADLKGRSILTVGEMEGFALRGGMIEFFTERNRVQFRVNLAAARAANLRISSKLLELAEVVNVQKE